MANIEAVEPLALTDFPHIPGVITPEQRANLSTVVELCTHWFNWSPAVGNADGTKKGKVPLNPKTGRMGRVNDAETAGTFDQAAQAIATTGGGGVGVLMTTAKPGVIALDFDHVVNADGSFSDLGREVFNQFKTTYIELSPSGTGLRVFALGQVNTERQRGGGVEFYPAGVGRWLRVTGAVLKSTVGVVVACQSGIDWAVSLLLAGSPDKGSASDKPGTSASPGNVGTLSIDQVLDRLAGYRGEWSKSPCEVQAALTLTSKRSPSKGLAGALDRLAGGDDKSEDDLLILCEAFRRGIDGMEDAADLLVSLAGSGGRDKVTERKDYRDRTAASAARAVLAEIESLKFSKLNFRGWENLPETTKGAAAIVLPDGMADALGLSGESLVTGKGGRVDATPGNVKVILTTDPRVSGLLAFNECSQNIERMGSFKVFDRHATTKTGNIQDTDIDFIGAWLHRVYGLKLNKGEVMQGVDMASRASSFDPVGGRMLALGKVWDGVPRVANWLRDYAMIDDTGCPDYVSAAGCCFLVGAVARALDPGCKFDTVLTVEGSGGGGKSTMFRILSDAVGPDLFTDGVHDVTNPVHRVEATEGRLIVEIAELAGFRRAADQEALKTVLTQTRDTVRKPYAYKPVEVLRRYVFAATTNNDQYLADPTGAMARRFHPVRTKATEKNPIDFAGLELAAPQLWAEAVRMYQGGYAPFIGTTGAAWVQWSEQRGRRQEPPPFEEEVNALMVRIDAGGVTAYDLARGITAKEAGKAIGFDEQTLNDPSGRALLRLTSTMKTLGFERQTKWASHYRWRMSQAAHLAASVMRREQAQAQGK